MRVSGKEVPECPFPRNNDRTTMAKSVDAITLDLATRAMGRMAVWGVPVASLLVCVFASVGCRVSPV